MVVKSVKKVAAAIGLLAMSAGQSVWAALPTPVAFHCAMHRDCDQCYVTPLRPSWPWPPGGLIVFHSLTTTLPPGT